MPIFLIVLLVIIWFIPEIEETQRFQEVTCIRHRWETNNKGILECSVCKKKELFEE